MKTGARRQVNVAAAAAATARCPGQPRPRAAFCIVGQPRTFAHQAAHGSLLELAIGAFGAEASTFLVLTDDDAGSTKGHAAMHDNATRTHAAIAALQPQAVRYGSRLDVLGRPAAAAPGCRLPARLRKPYFGTANQTWVVWYETWAKVRRCYELVQAHEAAHGFTFDWVVRLVRRCRASPRLADQQEITRVHGPRACRRSGPTSGSSTRRPRTARCHATPSRCPPASSAARRRASTTTRRGCRVCCVFVP